MHGPTALPPTVVLVHGAFADASCWSAVIGHLRAAGLAVVAPANPLRGLAHDAACLQALLDRAAGPVVLVGHGYGGAVITQAAACDGVLALCYVAAFGLDAGECVQDVLCRFAPTPMADATVTAVDRGGLRIRAERFAQVYAADLPPRTAHLLATAQRPIKAEALTERSGRPGWAWTPSWYAVATADRMLNPSAQRFMAQRMTATEHVLDASHAVVLSRPEAVAAMIREAVVQGMARDDGHGPAPAA
ncbi:alpha/beta fold hydrolase [Streptomyces dangxiongensis]|uniref:alpha/beta fold hydrolase n=1 Tax=Streptomyces dangxiongensis TaxID=1442032 RepID=UPI00196A1191|nr:alpha/beta hydrolase [Streptomyces dangxiongensis]